MAWRTVGTPTCERLGGDRLLRDGGASIAEQTSHHGSEPTRFSVDLPPIQRPRSDDINTSGVLREELLLLDLRPQGLKGLLNDRPPNRLFRLRIEVLVAHRNADPGRGDDPVRAQSQGHRRDGTYMSAGYPRALQFLA